MFNLFPFNLGNGFTFSSYTNITSNNGSINIFGAVNGVFGGNGFDNIDFNNTVINNLINGGYYNNDFYNSLNANNNYEQLNSIDINELANEFRALLSDLGKQLNIQDIAGEYMNSMNNRGIETNKTEEEYEFIKFKELNDMYVLKIDLSGVDLRELSVKYDPGVIKISLKRSEYDDSIDFNGYNNPKVIKREYKKTFNNIEEVDLSRVIKNVDGGSFNLRMPKKYVLEQGNNIIDVDKFIDEGNRPSIQQKIKK